MKIEGEEKIANIRYFLKTGDHGFVPTVLLLYFRFYSEAARHEREISNAGR